MEVLKNDENVAEDEDDEVNDYFVSSWITQNQGLLFFMYNQELWLKQF